jgi:hypothetical protein
MDHRALNEADLPGVLQNRHCSVHRQGRQEVHSIDSFDQDTDSTGHSEDTVRVYSFSDTRHHAQAVQGKQQGRGHRGQPRFHQLGLCNKCPIVRCARV